MTQTALVLAHATNRREPSLDCSIALGCSPTANSPRDSSVVASKIKTLAPPHREMKTCLPSADTRAEYGSAVSFTVRTTCRVDRSTIDAAGTKHMNREQFAAVRSDGDAAHEAGVVQCFKGWSQHWFLDLHLRRLLQGLAVPGELVDDVLCRARREQATSVRMPGETEPCVIERVPSRSTPNLVVSSTVMLGFDQPLLVTMR